MSISIDEDIFVTQHHYHLSKKNENEMRPMIDCGLVICFMHETACNVISRGNGLGALNFNDGPVFFFCLVTDLEVFEATMQFDWIIQLVCTEYD